jgi:hypothetical protein
MTDLSQFGYVKVSDPKMLSGNEASIVRVGKDIYQNKGYLDEKINEEFLSKGIILDANTKKKIIPFNEKEYYLDNTKFSVYYSNDNTHYYLIKKDTLIVTMQKYYLLQFTLSNSDEVCQEHLFMLKK